MQRAPILTYGGGAAASNERALFQRLLSEGCYARKATSGTKTFKVFEAKWNSLVAETTAGAIIGLGVADPAMEGVAEKSHQDLQSYYGQGVHTNAHTTHHTPHTTHHTPHATRHTPHATHHTPHTTHHTPRTTHHTPQGRGI